LEAGELLMPPALGRVWSHRFSSNEVIAFTKGIGQSIDVTLPLTGGFSLGKLFAGLGGPQPEPMNLPSCNLKDGLSSAVAVTKVSCESQEGVWGTGALQSLLLVLSLVVLVFSSEELAAGPPAGRAVSWGTIIVPSAPPGSKYKSIAAGAFHNLAVRKDGSLLGWGENYYGEAVVPPGLTNVTAIAAGDGFSLVLSQDGTVAGWGSGWASVVPTDLSNVLAIVAGSYHSLALRSDGNVIAWGDNQFGETNVPPDLTNAVAIAAGDSFSVAVRSNGTVLAWGDGRYGQTNTPSGLTNVIAVAAGVYHTVALKGDRTIVSWGSAVDPPGGLTNVIAVSAAANYSLALRGDGTVVAWGICADGQTNIPAGLSNVVTIAAGVGGGSTRCLALKSDGTVVAWGRGAYAEALTPDSLGDVVAIAASAYEQTTFGLALRKDGTVAGWGANWGNSNFQPWLDVPAGLDHIAGISLRWARATALRDDGTIVQWQPEGLGQEAIPESVTNVIAIASGDAHSLGLRRDGTVVAWGWNGVGQTSVPEGLTNVTAIAAGPSISMALREDGSVALWGDQQPWPLGPDWTNNIEMIAAGWFGSLAFRADNSLFIWADRSGFFTWEEYFLTNPPATKAVAAGADHLVILGCDGRIYATDNYGHTYLDVLPGSSNVVAIAAGNNYTLGITVDLQINSFGLTAEGPMVQFHTFEGQRYVVEYTLNLSTANWMPLAIGPITGNGNDVTVTDTTAIGTERRFYRVRLL
jgi:alpha-tubulin suppressor-like RCC1 family protein